MVDLIKDDHDPLPHMLPRAALFAQAMRASEVNLSGTS